MKSKLLIALLFVTFTAFSQTPQSNAEIKVEKSTYDFGDIKEADGNVTHVFEFVNTGTEPLVIQRVQASCGCTTPSWTKEPVAPGKKGTISATYNPKGRPGNFTKLITVYSNAKTSALPLYIKGTVHTGSQE